MAIMATEKLLTTRQAADYLGLTLGYVRELVRNGEIAAYNIGGEARPTYRMKRADLDAFLKRRKVAGRCSAETRAWRLRSISGGLK